MDAKELTIKQQALCEIAGMTSLDIDDAKHHYFLKYGKVPSFDEAYDTLSSMRMVFSRIFLEELSKLKIKEAV